MKMTNFLLQELKHVKPTEVKKELSVKKLVALANARAVKLAKSNIVNLKTSLTFSSIFNNILLPVFTYLIKFRNNRFYRLFRLIRSILPILLIELVYNLVFYFIYLFIENVNLLFSVALRLYN
jgi:hypothetical protein